MNNHEMTINKARRMIRNGELSAKELVHNCVNRIKEDNENINAFLEIFDDVFEEAEKVDSLAEAGEELGSLAGIPIAVKDNILIKGRRATAGSKMLESYHASYEATVVQKLKEAGAIIVGRTNMDEFAMGSSTEKSAWGVTKNPRDKTRVPGGSSGGSAASVVMGGALGALGSDTGGSIRQPASFCGAVGLKPTYGSVSRYGLIAMGSSLDVIGPLTKNVEDTKILYNVIKGKDRMDSTSVSQDDYTPPENKETLTVGVPSYVYEEDVNEDVRKGFEKTLSNLKEKGHKVLDIDLPNLKNALSTYYIIMPAEVSSNLARFDGVKYGAYSPGKNLLGDYLNTRGEKFGEEVRRRIIIGTYVLSAGYYDAYYRKATLVRDLVMRDYDNAFKDVDVIASPVAPDIAFKIGEKQDPLSMYLTDVFTVPSNLAGLPSISVPASEVEREGAKLPVGVQFTAPHMGEEVLFNIGEEVEKTL